MENNKITDAEYFTHPAISNSDLQVFAKEGKANFWNYKFGTKERKEKDSLLRGSLFHCKLLEPDEVEKRYKILPAAPSSPNQTIFCERIASGEDYIDAYRNSYKVGSSSAADINKKASDLYSTLKDYIDYLTTKQDEVAITQEMWDTTEAMIKVLKYHSPDILTEILPKLANTDLSKFTIYKYDEMPVFFEWNGVQCKCKIDRLYIIPQIKLILHLDFKTTRQSNDVYFKSKAMYEYQYDEQAAFYQAGVRSITNTFKQFDCCQNYHIISFLVACQTSTPYPVNFYKFSPTTISEATEKIERRLNMLKPYLDEYEKTNNEDLWLRSEEIHVI